MNGLPQMSMNEVYGITDTLHSATGSSVWLHRLLPSPQWWSKGDGHALLVGTPHVQQGSPWAGEKNEQGSGYVTIIRLSGHSTLRSPSERDSKVHELQTTARLLFVDRY